MVDITFPIPKTVVRLWKGFISSGIVDVIWKSFVAVLLLTVAVALLSAGPVGYAVGGIIIGLLVQEPVRDIVYDIWNRNFWVWRV